MKQVGIGILVAFLVILPGQRVFAASAAVLESRIAVLEGTVSQQQVQIQQLLDTIAAMQGQLAAVESNPAVQIGAAGYLRLDSSVRNGVIGPHVIFEGINLHVQNGAGESQNSGEDAPNGLGNLIIGYDEVDNNDNEQLNPGDRGGSHNLVIGWANKFPNVSSLVHGYRNTARGMFSATIAGWKNDTASYSAIISGSENVQESGDSSVILGGSRNRIEWMNNNLTLIGGWQNIMPDRSPYSVLIGGPNMLMP